MGQIPPSCGPSSTAPLHLTTLGRLPPHSSVNTTSTVPIGVAAESYDLWSDRNSVGGDMVVELVRDVRRSVALADFERCFASIVRTIEQPERLRRAR